MTRGRRSQDPPSLRARLAVRIRLEERLTEIERAVLTRIYAISNPADTKDRIYVDGLRASVSAALQYALAGLEHEPEHPPTIPPVLFGQARRAASAGVSLGTVLRRYFAGYSLFGDFLTVQMEDDGLQMVELKHVLRTQALLFDRLIAAITNEYNVETRRPTGHAELVRRLLEGELVDASPLAYDFDAYHLGVIATGSDGIKALHQVIAASDSHLLIRPAADTVWAWLGAQFPIDPGEAASLAPATTNSRGRLAFGESAEGVSGWRLTHRQAVAALAVAQRGDHPVVRYSDVALIAAALCDDLLGESLRRLYLEPLEAERDRGEVARETLRAYFDVERNSSSTAAALGVTRQTVSNRLRAISERLGKPMGAQDNQLELAIRLSALDFTDR